MSSLRVAILGSFGHVVVPMKTLQRTRGVEVVGLAACCEVDDPKQLQAGFPVAASAPVFADHRELLRQAKPDLAIVSTRLDRIAPVAIDAAMAGCHLICEKPLALEEGCLRELHSIVSERRLHCLPILENRQHPVLQAAVAAIHAAGRIGQVVLANARKSYKWGTRPEWFGDRKRYGGTIPWIGIHALDFIHAVAGKPFTSVAAMHSNAAHPQRRDCEDNCTLVMALEGGVHATASIDYFRPSGAKTHGDDWIRVVGTKGVIEAYLDRGHCMLLADDGTEQTLALPPAIPTFDAFLNALIEGRKYSFDETRTGFMLTQAVLAARDAADNRQVVSIRAISGTE